MSDTVSLKPEELDAKLTTFEGYASELTTIASDMNAITIGINGSRKSSGPSFNGARSLSFNASVAATDMSLLITGAVAHLKSIRDDIIAADNQ
jgi:hypothetical protein